MGIRTLSFRQKIFFSFLILFLFLVALVFPIAEFVSRKIQDKTIENQAVKVIRYMREANDKEELIEKAKMAVSAPLFSLSLFSGSELLYESPFFNSQDILVFKKFSFQGKEYTLRLGFPKDDLDFSKSTFIFATFSLSATILLLFGILAGIIVQVLTRPIKQIIAAIKSYRGGKEEFLPQIHLPAVSPKDDFGKLTETLNLLSQKIESQLSTLTKEKNNKSAILESLGEGVIAVDAAMTVIYINHMAAVFLDLPKEEILGKNFIVSKQEKCHRLIVEAQTRGAPALAVLQLGKRFLDVAAVPRGKEGSILVLQDRTSLHKVIELGRDFIANASHELKTPITIIRGFAETLHDHPELSHETYKEITAKIVSNCERMEKLVRNLLTLAAIDEGLPRSRLQECDIEDIVQTASQTILTIHPNAHITTNVVGEKPYLLLDSDLVLQAVINLIDNAVKYSKPPAEVTVIIEKKEKEVEIRVSDKGMGIPPEDLDRIFERFFAVDKSYSRSLGGSGLGLSIVARIVEKHKGRIAVDSELGKGSTFTLIFPILEEDY